MPVDFFTKYKHSGNQRHFRSLCVTVVQCCIRQCDSANDFFYCFFYLLVLELSSNMDEVFNSCITFFVSAEEQSDLIDSRIFLAFSEMVGLEGLLCASL